VPYTITESYKEAQRRIALVQKEKGAMIDEIRKCAREKVISLRDNFCIDETEQAFRDVFHRIVVLQHSSPKSVEEVCKSIRITSFTSTDVGFEAEYSTSWLTDELFTLSMTFEELQERIDYEKRLQDKITEFKST
jgi:hypothetical protein